MTPDEEKIMTFAAEAEKEIADILKPQGGRFGTGAPPPPVFRPVMNVVAQPETPETPDANAPPLPLPELLEKHYAHTSELLGLVIVTLNDRVAEVEGMLDQRLSAIERVLGVKK